MTQMIASALDSDEVNSITDTVEADQIALLLKGVYYDLATDLNLPEHNGLFQLNASGSSLKPCIMTVPTNVTRIEVIQYDCKESGDTYPKYQEIKYKPFQDFLVDQQSLREDATGVGSMSVSSNGESFTLMYRTDSHPTFYTTMDDQTILFDSYLSSLDTTLQKTKTMCMGNLYPEWSHTDAFQPDLDPTQFSLFLNKAKVRAFNELKQVRNAEAEKETRRQRIIVQKRQEKVNRDSQINRRPGYGR